MKPISGTRAKTLILVLAVFAVGFAGPVFAQPYRYFPSGDVNDGRFLSHTGSGLQSLGEHATLVQFIAPKTASNLEIGVFDGDTGGRWDLGTTALEYTLFADPDADGSGTLQVAQWLGSTMPDNDWFAANIPTGPEAAAPSGNFFYVMAIKSTNPSTTYWSNFKVRTDGYVTMQPQAFAFTAAMFDFDDASSIYPDWPLLTTTNYDGTWEFQFFVHETTKTVTIWDGDLDHGSYDLTENDTDDPDTPNSIMPPWNPGADAVYEGVAIGSDGATGAPADDSKFETFRRSPSVRYILTTPDGRVFSNTNPSGNREWERFCVSADLTVPADHYTLISLPPGVYTVQLLGTDIDNLNAMRLPYPIVDGEKPDPYIVGDFVWEDVNGDGVQDPGEPGIPNVLVQLIDSGGTEIAITTTDANGLYEFGVPAGQYTVRVAAVNFLPTGPLNGMLPTTGSNDQTHTVTNANVLTYDFGYKEQSEDRVCILVAAYITDSHKLLVLATSTNAPFAQLRLSVPGTSIQDVPMQYVGNGLYRYYETVVPPDDVVGKKAIVISSHGGRACKVIVASNLKCDDCGDDEDDCTRTQTFWRDHPTSWPVSEIEIGGVTYQKADAIANMNNPGGGDKTYDMFRELVATKLNLIMGAEASCIEQISEAADWWMFFNGPVGSGVTVLSPSWVNGATLHDSLQQYNNGQLCGRHCDDECGCEGGVTELTLMYRGAEAKRVRITQEDGRYIFNQDVQPGEMFTIHGEMTLGTFGKEITFYLYDISLACVVHTIIKTDCTDPVGPGLVAGDFLVVAGKSRYVGTLCPVDEAPQAAINKPVDSPLGDHQMRP